MQKNEFFAFVNGVVPVPDEKTNIAWADLCLDMQDDPDDDILQDLANAFSFVKKFFNDDILQKTYDIVKFGNNILPWEIVSAALLLADGEKPENLGDDDGESLRCIKIPAYVCDSFVSPLALITFVMDGEETGYYTASANATNPFKWKAAAVASVWRREVLGDLKDKDLSHKELRSEVYDTMLRMTPDYEVSERLGGRIIMGNGEGRVARAMKNIFGKYKAVTEHIRIDFDGDFGVRIDRCVPEEE